MDRRSWLWRRKSSEKSPGETDSSGSMSAHSNDQILLNHGYQSPEVTSKVETVDEEVNDSVKTLKEKLSAALMNISTKEDLVKQHAKVAEEAVSGWEKAEKEVLVLKQRLDASLKKNVALEDRVEHLDGALKECVRQLRQAREEQEQKTNEAFTKKSREWESTKSELESQLQEVLSQLQIAKAEAANLVDPELQTKLLALEKENSALKLELLSLAEELELRIIERDLSTQAAETASRQHLESIKKLTKVEAECRRLKAVARKAPPANDQKSHTVSSICVESFVDSQSDSAERLLSVETDVHKLSELEMNECETTLSDSCMSAALDTKVNQHINEKAIGRNLMAPSMESNLMDDFLEMERIAALPDAYSGSGFDEAGPQSSETTGGQNPLNAELEILIHRTAELEEKLEAIEAENLDLKMALSESQKQLGRSKDLLKEEEKKWAELQIQLTFSNNSRQAAEEEVKAASIKREVAESRLRESAFEIITLKSQVALLEEEVEKEHVSSAENIAKLKELEDELSNNSRQAAEKEVKAANMKREAAVEIKSLQSTVTFLEKEVEKERALSAENIAKCKELEDEHSKNSRQGEVVKAANMKKEAAEPRLREATVEIQNLPSKVACLEEQFEKGCVLSAENTCKFKELEDKLSKNSRQDAEEGVKASNMKREVAESRYIIAELKIKTLLAKVALLEQEVGKERALSAENIAKCNELKDELSKMKHEAPLHHVAVVNEELKIKQDKELALAASRFAECQKTIASLGQRLKSLATMEDFLIDNEKPLELMLEVRYPRNTGEELKLHSTDLNLSKRDSSNEDNMESSLPPNPVVTLD